MIKIAVCDDEPAACEKLKHRILQTLSRWRETSAVTCYASGIRLLSSPVDFDLIFLDIRMPGEDGMTLAGRLRQKGFGGDLIFVSSFPEYMPEAFAVEALDYLCKPVDQRRLEAALKRGLKRLEDRTEQSLFIQTMNWCKTIRFKDIYYCEVINRKIYIHARNEVIDYYGRMKELENQAGSRLFKCHRSYLINLDHLLEYRGGTAVLESGEQIPVARSCRQLLMERIWREMAGEE